MDRGQAASAPRLELWYPALAGAHPRSRHHLRCKTAPHRMNSGKAPVAGAGPCDSVAGKTTEVAGDLGAAPRQRGNVLLAGGVPAPPSGRGRPGLPRLVTPLMRALAMAPRPVEAGAGDTARPLEGGEQSRRSRKRLSRSKSF